MFDNEILSTAEKLKKVRELLQITQQELCGEEVNRGLFSRMENGKANLSKNQAEKIAERINQFAVERDMLLHTTGAELLQPETVQAEKIVKQHITYLQEIGVNKEREQEVFEIYKTVQRIVKKHKISCKVEFSFYKLISEYGYAVFQFDLAKKAASRAMMLSVRHCEDQLTLEAILQLTRIYTRTEEFNSIIILEDSLNEFISVNTDLEVLKRIYFNVAMAYEDLGEYDKCIEQLETIRNKFEITEEQELDIAIMIAYSYRKKEEYPLAEQKYKEIEILANKLNNDTALAIAYHNLANIYLIQGLVSIAHQYINKAVSIEGVTDPTYRAKIFKRYLDIMVIENNIEEVEASYKEALHRAMEIKDLKMRDSIISKVFGLYVDNKIHEKVWELLIYIDEEILSQRIVTQNLMTIFAEAAYAYKKISRTLSDAIFERHIQIIHLLRDKQTASIHDIL